ncbi:hypothetical protein [Roseibium marinum]|uniref:Uncharacterized protein n=1 Tax=Roseibium marinum TaxID=281252 RepID=A0A2S3UXH5_9HYPH|nr:hypothetical protein [Roseibium marinum]POF32428.1 hypothetical protein CLV41_103352 [Roseibium marinum]
MTGGKLVVLAAGIFGSVLVNFAYSAERATQGDAFQKSVALLRTGDCPAAWRILWPQAKAQNAQAFTLLAESLVALGLNPPGLPEDDLGWKRTYLFLAVNGYSAKSNLAGLELLKLLKSDLLAQPAGEKVALCLENDEKRSRCVDEAVKAKLIPSFEEFVSEVEEEQVSSDQPKCKSFRR